MIRSIQWNITWIKNYDKKFKSLAKENIMSIIKRYNVPIKPFN